MCDDAARRLVRRRCVSGGKRMWRAQAAASWACVSLVRLCAIIDMECS
jgi:hypothetical protein